MTKREKLIYEMNLKKLAATGAMALATALPLAHTNPPPTKPDTVQASVKPASSVKSALDGFINALHQVESEGKDGPIIGDNGAALGPFQIHKEYWADVKDNIGGKYSDVANYDYAKKVVVAYLLKYGKKAIKNKDWETLAKMHNGGPRGPQKPATEKYWNKVKKFLQ